MFNFCFNRSHALLKADNEALRAYFDEFGKQNTPLTPAARMTADQWRLIIRAKVREYGDDIAEIYPPDDTIGCFTLEQVQKRCGYLKVDKITYVPTTMDCDDFARMLFGDFASLVWTDLHALNFFVTPDGRLYFIEPQTSQISERLEGWQGKQFRIFVGA